MESIELNKIESDLNKMVKKCPAPELMENGVDICKDCSSKERCFEVN